MLTKKDMEEKYVGRLPHCGHASRYNPGDKTFHCTQELASCPRRDDNAGFLGPKCFEEPSPEEAARQAREASGTTRTVPPVPHTVFSAPHALWMIGTSNMVSTMSVPLSTVAFRDVRVSHEQTREEAKEKEAISVQPKLPRTRLVTLPEKKKEA